MTQKGNGIMENNDSSIGLGSSIIEPHGRHIFLSP